MAISKNKKDHNLTFHLKELEKEQTKPNAIKRKETNNRQK
jgi:hypothetical protein